MRGMGISLLLFSLSLLSLTSPSHARTVHSSLASRPQNLAAVTQSSSADTLIKPIEEKSQESGFGAQSVREGDAIPLDPVPLPPAVLSDLQVKGAELEPKFNATVFDYSTSVGEDVSAITVVAVVPRDELEDYEIKFNTWTLISGEESPSFAVAGNGETVNITIAVRASGKEPSNYLISVYRGKKSSVLWRITKWALYILGGLLALGALLYILSSIYACCKGTRTLAESGHTLGWWPFGYFAHGQQAGYSGVAPEPSRLLAGPATAQP